MLFLTGFWRFLRSNKLEQLEFKLEKIIGIEKPAGKVRKNRFCRRWKLEAGKAPKNCCTCHKIALFYIWYISEVLKCMCIRLCYFFFVREFSALKLHKDFLSQRYNKTRFCKILYCYLCTHYSHVSKSGTSLRFHEIVLTGIKVS